MYPDLFILIENVEEVTISETTSRVLGGDVIKTSSDLKEIMKNYQDCKKSGKNVLFALPNTPEDFVIENVAMMGIMR
jgi:hypothetical protein